MIQVIGVICVGAVIGGAYNLLEALKKREQAKKERGK